MGAKQATDKQKFIEYAGEDLYSRFASLKSGRRLRAPENDYYYWINQKSVEELTAKIQEIENKISANENRRRAKRGAELLYSGSGWKIYKITTPGAARYYGKGTKWCISGKDNKGYFRSYIPEGSDGYYFLISDTDEKWCYTYSPEKPEKEVADENEDEGLAEELVEEQEECASKFTFWSQLDSKNDADSLFTHIIFHVPLDVLKRLPGLKNNKVLEQDYLESIISCYERHAHNGVFCYTGESAELMASIFSIGLRVDQVVIGRGVKEIPSRAFFKSDIKKVSFEVGSQLESIGEDAFAECHKLKTIDFPSTLRKIGDEAFAYCTSLKSVNLSKCTNLTTVQYYAFSDCEKLRCIRFPESLSEMGCGALYRCERLSTVKFANGTRIESFRRDAVHYAERLKHFGVLNAVTIEFEALEGCKRLKSIRIGKDTSQILNGAFSKTHIKRVVVYGEHRPEMFSACCGLSDGATIYWADAGIKQTWADTKLSIYKKAYGMA